MAEHKVSFFSSEAFLLHRPPAGHPERPDRLRRLLNHLRSRPIWGLLDHRSPTPAPIDSILAVHSRGYLDTVRDRCASGGGMLDMDTHVVRESFDTAVLAAGCVLNAVDVVLGGKAAAAFCAVRPPGHHAERDRALGFCLFNNVAIGARHAQQHHGVERVAILDWDVHHGNGTQHTFEDDPTVLYVSLHQYPFYPGTGATTEEGTGKGEGYTMNFPLPAGTGQEAYLSIFKDQIVPALARYDPALLLISAGFDAHKDDPLGGMVLTEESFGKMTGMVKGRIPLVSVLEGGYDLDALAQSVEMHLVALHEESDL